MIAKFIKLEQTKDCPGFHSIALWKKSTLVFIRPRNGAKSGVSSVQPMSSLSPV